MAKRSALGRGLGALMDDADIVKGQISGIAEIELSQIEANPYQPRTSFDQESLQELAESIREIGLIQPVTLRKGSGGKYQIIAGERRFRAAQLAGLVKIPAFIRDVNDESMLEMALVENIQREDLNPIEVGLSFQRLIEECNFTQETLSSRVGKKRSTVANFLRLLKLPAVIQKGLIEKELTMGHAKALVNVPAVETQLMVFEQIKKHDFSVRKVEELVRQLNQDKKEVKKQPEEKYPHHYQPFKESLEKVFPAQVKLMANQHGKGKIVISFKSEADLRKIVNLLDTQ